MPLLYRFAICTALLFTTSQASRIAESRIASVINSADEAEGAMIAQSEDPEECVRLFPPPKGCYATLTNAADMAKCPETCAGIEPKVMEEQHIVHGEQNHVETVERGHIPATVNAGSLYSRDNLRQAKVTVPQDLLKANTDPTWKDMKLNPATPVHHLQEVHVPEFQTKLGQLTPTETVHHDSSVHVPEFQTKLGQLTPTETVHHDSSETLPGWASKARQRRTISEHTVAPVETNVALPAICKQLKDTNDKKEKQGKPKKKCNSLLRNTCPEAFCAQFD
jgi:hypothetical protein